GRSRRRRRPFPSSRALSSRHLRVLLVSSLGPGGRGPLGAERLRQVLVLVVVVGVARGRLAADRGDLARLDELLEAAKVLAHVLLRLGAEEAGERRARRAAGRVVLELDLDDRASS